MRLGQGPLTATALLLMLAGPLRAEVTPRAGDGDPHIQSVAYDPQEVVALHVTAGFAVTVQFGVDERIETVSLGDGADWQVQANRRADHLVVKPAGLPATTNMTVFTDQRVYNFTLYSSPPGFGLQPYLVSFTYPPALPPVTGVAPAPEGYRLQGAKALWPLAISDDGRFTTIRWPDSTDLPAVYRELGSGPPALVNGVMRDGALVVEGVYPRLTFVLGKARATATRHGGKP